MQTFEESQEKERLLEEAARRASEAADGPEQSRGDWLPLEQSIPPPQVPAQTPAPHTRFENKQCTICESAR